MRIFTCLLLVILQLATVNAQPKTYGERLSSQQLHFIFTDSLKNALKINYHIFTGYKYADNSGTFICTLTESNDSVGNNKDTFNHSIMAINFKVENGKWEKVWELNDKITVNGKEENSIWFWTKYCSFLDVDNDGIIDPIIIYGTNAMNGYDDGRIKIVVVYKGQKILIRHQNGVLDDERNTQVDKAFYALPAKLQNIVKATIELMITNRQAIFPYGWQKAMENKKLNFSEREN